MAFIVEPGYKTYSISKKEHQSLLDFYSQTVPFKSTYGKYHIHSSIMYPRYKVRASFQASNAISINKRSIAKNSLSADYTVIPVKEILQVLNSGLDGNNMTSYTTKNTENPELKIFFRYLDARNKSIIRSALEYYSLPAEDRKPLIDFSDFASNLEDVKEILTIPKAEFLVDLIKSGDAGSVKLAMESLTNYDIKKSLPAIMYVLSHANFYTIKGNDYYKSTAFKTFRDRFQIVGGHTVEYVCNSSYERVYECLVTDGVTTHITKSEVEFFRNVMLESCIKIMKENCVDLKITLDNVHLQFPPEVIVDDELVEQQSKELEEAIMEDDSAFYVLVDDTNETT